MARPRGGLTTKSRNHKAIEYKHRNISAVLNLYGTQSLKGYKPLPNFQRLLLDVVGRALMQDHALDEAAIRSVETPAEVPLLSNFDDFVVKPPLGRATRDSAQAIARPPIKRDYLEREARNRSLGLAGELLVMKYEARRLHLAGKKSLSERIEHISRTQGDGAGFDVLSFEEDGQERFIEVKTTAYVAETPFFVSQNETNFSADEAKRFYLYRLFCFRDKPRMFSLHGSLKATCKLDPITFRATVL